MTRTSRMPEAPRSADQDGMAGNAVKDREVPASGVRSGLAALDVATPDGFGDLRHSLTTRWMVQQR